MATPSGTSEVSVQTPGCRLSAVKPQASITAPPATWGRQHGRPHGAAGRVPGRPRASPKPCPALDAREPDRSRCPHETPVPFSQNLTPSTQLVPRARVRPDHLTNPLGHCPRPSHPTASRGVLDFQSRMVGSARMHPQRAQESQLPPPLLRDPVCVRPHPGQRPAAAVCTSLSSGGPHRASAEKLGKCLRAQPSCQVFPD